MACPGDRFWNVPFGVSFWPGQGLYVGGVFLLMHFFLSSIQTEEGRSPDVSSTEK